MIDTLKEENLALTNKQIETEKQIDQLKDELGTTQQSLIKVLEELNGLDERHSTILTELNSFKESLMNTQHQTESIEVSPTPPTSSVAIAVAASAAMRSIPAPSKIMVDDNKKKDNRLLELRRITREHMNVDDEEAGLRLYKLQKTMIHV
ncbi:hypothetical protein ABG067_008965, partial [Albugo candida]